jgi:hypothetical protein
MPLCLSSGFGQVCGLGWLDESVDLAGGVALEAADGFAAGFFFCLAAFEVVAGAGIPAQAADDDAVQGGVGLPVTAAVVAVALGFAGGCLDGADAAERGE